MNNKMKLLFVAIIIGVGTSVNAADGVEKLFNNKCAVCHVKTKPSDMQTLVAPPVMGVIRHVKMKYNTKEDAIKFISEYVLNPQKDKAVCMPQKIKHFGLMPSQKGNVTEAELQTIASWMYDNFPPKGKMSKGMKCQSGKCQSAK